MRSRYITTTTYLMKDPGTGAQLVTDDALTHDRRVLELTQWTPVLSDYGWQSHRPPTIHVEYKENILKIISEIPTVMFFLSEADFKEASTDFSRALLSLVFPHTNIAQLPVEHQVSEEEATAPRP